MAETEIQIRKRTDIAALKELHWLVGGKLNLLTGRIEANLTTEEKNKLYLEVCDVIKQLFDTVIELSEQLHNYKDREIIGLLKQKIPIKINCFECGNEFVKRGRQIYCSPECRIKHNYHPFSKSKQYSHKEKVEEKINSLPVDTFKRKIEPIPEMKPEPNGKKCIYIPSGYTMCHNPHCKKVFKSVQLENFCSEACEEMNMQTNQIRGLSINKL
jgi:hypothetical protein